MTYRLRIAHLYPDVMNIYGDRGNVIALRHRCEARGIEVEVVDVNVGDAFDPDAFDIVLIGGGQDREQQRIADDLVARGRALTNAFERGLPALVVCGGFQLFGNQYIGADGKPMPGIGLYDMEARHPGPGAVRCIGDVVMTTELGEIVGFENHGGRTYLGPGQPPFGRVVYGHGNNSVDGSEGARRFNTFGTYLHGSVLPKNPALADELIRLALQRRYGEEIELEPLDDTAEVEAHRSAARVAKRRDRRARQGASPGALVRRLSGRLRDLVGR